MKAIGSGWTKELSVLGCFCLLIFSAPAPQTARHSDIAVVVNPGTPVSELSLTEVRKVFLGDRQYWNSRVPVELFIRAPVAREREVILKVIYEMTETQYNHYWIAKNFRAEAVSAPKMVYSNEQANELLAAIPGAIAFMDRKDVRSPLKVVRVDGRLPGEPGYVLK
jgi:hypothetical protein